MKRSGVTRFMLAAIVAVFPAVGSAAEPSLKALDFAPIDVSGDGSVVVGRRDGPNVETVRAVRWTAAGGSTTLGPGEARAVSADGSVVVGARFFGAVRWTADGKVTPLGEFHYGNGAGGVAADGATIVGSGSESWAGGNGIVEAFRWTTGAGFVGLGTGRYGHSAATGISADGSVIVGTAGDLWIPTDSDGDDEPSTYHAVRWTAWGGMRSLGWLAGFSYSEASAASADGSVIVGRSWDPAPGEAFRWTSATGMVGLGTLPGHEWSRATDVSADGFLIVGNSGLANRSEAESTPFLWDEVNGLRPLKDVLAGWSVDVTGWSLGTATAISADGQTIVGTGTDPSGRSVGWIVTIPESGTIWLLVGSGLLRRRKRGSARNRG
jgi:probable HAF family extracellular repeat protein